MATAKIGRPRSEKSREAVIRATHDLLCEKGGAGLTIEGIARRAGVGKPTIYRWWPSAADIVLEVLLRRADTDIPAPVYASLPETLRLFLRQSMQAITAWGGPHLRFLMAHAQQDEAFGERFRDNFTAKRRVVLRSIFEQALEKGELAPGQNLEILLDIVFGAMWYRLLTGQAPIDERFADELAATVVKLAHAP